MTLPRSKIEGRDDAQRAKFGRIPAIPANDADAAIKIVQGNVEAVDAALKAPQYLVAAASATLANERVTTDTDSIKWNHATAAQAKAERAALTGDISAAQDSNTTTLATVNGNVGSFGLAASVAQFTVNAKGLITAAANVAIQIAISAVTGLQTALDALTAAVALKANAVTTLTAGAGLTGGGDLSANRTFDVGAGSGIAVNANDVQIATNGVSDVMLRDSAAVSVIGRSANSSGDPTDIAAASNDTIFRRVSDALGFGQLTLGMAAANLWTYAKLQQVSATSRILGRISSGAGDIEELTGANVKTIAGLATSTTANRLARYTDTAGSTGQTTIAEDGSGNVSGIVSQSMTGYMDIAEIAAPSDPAANVARVYAKDDGGTTKLFMRDSAGAETEFGEGGGGSGITAGTAQASTSGTSIDFTGIPAAVKRITIMFDGVSLSGTDHFLVQIGDSGGLETTGYVSESTLVSAGGNAAVSSTAGFIMSGATATRVWSGHMTVTRITGNVWVASFAEGTSAGTAAAAAGGGRKELSAELDRVSVTRTGTDTFDLGQINIFYE